MLRYINFFVFIFCFLHISAVLALNSPWKGIEEAKVRIISPFSKSGNNSIIYLGLDYQLKSGWKTYWHSPGEGGYPQKLDWSKTKNVSSLDIKWPTPQEFSILGLNSIGYEKEVIFPLKIKLIDISKPSFFSFKLDFLTCNEICIPVNTHLELILPPPVIVLFNLY